LSTRRSARIKNLPRINYYESDEDTENIFIIHGNQKKWLSAPQLEDSAIARALLQPAKRIQVYSNLFPSQDANRSVSIAVIPGKYTVDLSPVISPVIKLEAVADQQVEIFDTASLPFNSQLRGKRIQVY
jgi:hypothetical protein